MLLEKAYVQRGWEWHVEDVGDHVVDSLLLTYDAGYLYLSDNTTERTVSFKALSHHLDVLKKAYTVNQLLTKITMADLPPHEETLPLARAKHVVCHDIHTHNLAVSLGNVGYGAGTKIPTSEITDLILTPNGNVDTAMALEEGCMVTVNGQMRPLIRTGDRLAATGVDQFLSKSNGTINTSMLWDFRAVGGAEFIPFNPGELSKIPTKNLNGVDDLIRYRYTGPIDLSDKSVFLVIDGRPMFMANLLKVYSRDTLTFTMSRRQAAEWLLEYPPSRRYGHNENNLLQAGLKRNSWDPLSMLTSGYSGLLVVNSNRVGITKHPLGRTDIPGLFTYFMRPVGMAVMEDNTLRDYIIAGYDGDQASLSITDGQKKYRIDNFIRTDDLTLMSKTEVTEPILRALRGHMVNVYTL